MRQNTPSIQTIALTTTALLTTLYITKTISKYGLSGTLRLLWEGDHLTPQCRESMDTLDDVQHETLPKLEEKLEKIEIMVETALLNSVDGPSNDFVKQNNNNNNNITDEAEKEAIKLQLLTQYPKIKTDLGSTSYSLDKTAAKVDSVKTGGEMEVKVRKKELSNLIVGFMERADRLIALCGGGGDDESGGSSRRQ